MPCDFECNHRLPPRQAGGVKDGSDSRGVERSPYDLELRDAYDIYAAGGATTEAISLLA